MKKLFFPIYLLLLIIIPGCEIIVGIFKAGFWSAIILVVIVVVIGWWGFTEYRKRKF